MTKTMFTPGPWRVSLSDATDVNGDTSFSPIGGCGCCDSPWANPPEQERRAERDANARLISAAPELYEALQELLEVSGDAKPRKRSLLRHTDAKDAARAALAKARGEQ